MQFWTKIKQAPEAHYNLAGGLIGDYIADENDDVDDVEDVGDVDDGDDVEDGDDDDDVDDVEDGDYDDAVLPEKPHHGCIKHQQ